MTPSVQNVRIWWDTSVGAYHMTSPYNATLVDELKKLIPYSDREYAKDTKTWTFNEKWYQPTLNLFNLLGIKPSFTLTRQQAENAQQTPAQKTKPLTQVMEEFLRVLPYDAAQAAYRKAAMILHPDRGGDMAKMTALNAAWDRLQKEVYGQQ